MDICYPWSQEELCCLRQTHHAQGLNLMTLCWLSTAINSLVHTALVDSSLGIIGGTLSARLPCSDFSVRVELEFLISDQDGDELLGALFDGDDGWPFIHNQ